MENGSPEEPVFWKWLPKIVVLSLFFSQFVAFPLEAGVYYFTHDMDLSEEVPYQIIKTDVLLEMLGVCVFFDKYLK